MSGTRASREPLAKPRPTADMQRVEPIPEMQEAFACVVLVGIPNRGPRSMAVACL